ncbi:MAG: hypothetical protein U0132_00640 [Gemmatimonadaceae bacterium]
MPQPDPSDVPDPTRLLGAWQLVRADPGLDVPPRARLEFAPGGRLLYHVPVQQHWQTLTLIYRAEGTTLHLGVPMTAQERIANFSFGPGGALVFDFGGLRAIFIREL